MAKPQKQRLLFISRKERDHVNCRMCGRPLLTKRSRDRGIGPQCERKERWEKEQEKQNALVQHKELVKVIKQKKGTPTVIEWHGQRYALQPQFKGVKKV